MKKNAPWRLRVVRRAPRVGGEEKWGYCDLEKREIVISKETERHGIAREILLHEAIHRHMWFLDEEAVEHLARELDFVLDVAEAEHILEL